MPEERDEAEQLAEILRRNSEVTRCKLELLKTKEATKLARELLADAQVSLSHFLSGLKPCPLFDGPTAHPRPVIEVDRDAPPDAIDRTPIRGETNDMIAAAMDEAEARKAVTYTDPFDAGPGGQVTCSYEGEGKDESWRDTLIWRAFPEKLVTVSTCNALGNIGINTLGKLSDAVETLDDQERFAKRAGIKPKVAERLFDTLDKYIAALKPPALADDVRICNRCNTQRPAVVGVCPDCGSPEFRLPPGTDPEPAAKPKRKRAAKAVANG